MYYLDFLVECVLHGINESVLLSCGCEVDAPLLVNHLRLRCWVKGLHNQENENLQTYHGLLPKGWEEYQRAMENRIAKSPHQYYSLQYICSQKPPCLLIVSSNTSNFFPLLLEAFHVPSLLHKCTSLFSLLHKHNLQSLQLFFKTFPHYTVKTHWKNGFIHCANHNSSTTIYTLHC